MPHTTRKITKNPLNFKSSRKTESFDPSEGRTANIVNVENKKLSLRKRSNFAKQSESSHINDNSANHAQNAGRLDNPYQLLEHDASKVLENLEMMGVDAEYERRRLTVYEVPKKVGKQEILSTYRIDAKSFERDIVRKKKEPGVTENHLESKLIISEGAQQHKSTRTFDRERRNEASVIDIRSGETDRERKDKASVIRIYPEKADIKMEEEEANFLDICSGETVLKKRDKASVIATLTSKMNIEEKDEAAVIDINTGKMHLGKRNETPSIGIYPKCDKYMPGTTMSSDKTTSSTQVQDPQITQTTKKLEMSPTSFYKRLDVIKQYTLSNISYSAMPSDSMYTLRKYSIDMFINDYSTAGCLKRAYKYLKNTCRSKPFIYETIPKNKTLTQMADAIRNSGPIQSKNWSIEDLDNRNFKDLEMLLTLIYAKADLDLKMFDTVSIYYSIITFVRVELLGLMDPNIYLRSRKILKRGLHGNYGQLRAFRDLTFDSEKRYILDCLLKFMNTQLRNTGITGWTRQFAFTHLRASMLPVIIEEYSDWVDPQWHHMWIESLIDQGGVKYVPSWVFDYDVLKKNYLFGPNKL